MDLEGDTIEMVVAPADDFEDSLQINGGDYVGQCLEIVLYDVDIHLSSEALTTTLYGLATIQNKDGNESDRIELFAGFYYGPGFEGWLLEGAEMPHFIILSRSAVGSAEKIWTMHIDPGSESDGDLEFECRNVSL